MLYIYGFDVIDESKSRKPFGRINFIKCSNVSILCKYCRIKVTDLQIYLIEFISISI